MSPSTRSRAGGRRTVLAAGLALLALSATSLAGCADSSDGHSRAATPSIAVDAALHNALPADVRDRGELRIITDASYAPASSFASDGRTIIGFEPDLGAAIGAVLGVKVRFVDEPFDDLPGSVRSGKADLIMSAMTDTKEREGSLDFVDYFSAGTALVVQRGNPHGISDLGSLCGQTVAVEKGTVQADLLNREQEHCASRRIKLITSRTNDDALLQVRTGRAAAIPMDFPPAELLTTSTRTSNQYQLASTEQYEPGQYGIGISKQRSPLRDAVRGALSKLIDSGAYVRVLSKWHVETGAVRTASINSAGS